MTPVWLRALQHLHGPLGWFAVAALMHPAILLRRPKRKATLATALATGLTTAATSLGAFIYPEYRVRIKQQIFIHTPTIGWLFERKEHLAVGAAGFAWVGLLLYLASRRDGSDDLARASHRAYVIAAALALATAVLGTTVAAVRSL